MRCVVLLAVLAVQFAIPVCAAEARWNLVWQDSFDRAEVGPEWFVCRGKASVRDGRLLLQGGGATIITERRFKPDVPPCDLSATIGANNDFGYGYLYAFGGAYNQINQLLGRGVGLVDRNQTYAPGSANWQRSQMMCADDPQKTALYKWLTGERVYDEYTMRFGDPAQKYRVNYNLDEFLTSFESTAKAGRHNLELQTTEVLSTDRAALVGALTVFGAYTGAVTGLRDAATPTFAVTYDTPDEDFAAVVTESTDQRLRVWLYSFRPAATRIGLKLWRLVPGYYVLNQGELLPGEYAVQHRYGWTEPQTAALLHRADAVYVTVPPGKVWVVDLRLRKPVETPRTAPDLAIGRPDVVREAHGLHVTVHNIGNAPSAPSSLVLEVQDGGKWRKVGQASVPAIPAPKGFVPSRASVRIEVSLPAQPAKCRLVLDPADKQYEICETNNTIALE